MPKDRYPHTLEDAYYYMFAGYVAKFGKDKIGVRDAITTILIDLKLDPSSREDRKWAANKFRVANPNYYDPDNKKKADVNKNTTTTFLYKTRFLPPIPLTLKNGITIGPI